MGYGYGVWLVIQDKTIDSIIKKNNIKKHTSHVTVMCNMSYSDAIKLSKEIQGTYKITVCQKYILFNTNEKYSDNDNLVASGFNCNVENWQEIINIAKKYKGSTPEKPHLSVVYHEDKNKLPENLTIQNIYTKGSIYPVDINSNYSNEWSFITKN